MKTSFEYSDYRQYLRDCIETFPRKGFGQLSKLAAYMNVHSSLLSQIFSGHKHLTIDMAALVAEYFALGADETEYFLGLVQLERAGNEALRRVVRRNLAALKERAADLRHIISAEKILNEEQRAVFYSSWAYTAARQLCAIGKGADLATLAGRLDLPMAAIKRIMDFLTSAGLCTEGSGTFRIGPASTYVDPSSPWARVHHRNWRHRAASEMERERESDFFYTSPLTISEQDAARVRRILVEAVQHINDVVDPSPSEVHKCLSIDWFSPIVDRTAKSKI